MEAPPLTRCPENHADVSMAGQEHIDPGAELDQADTLAAFDEIAHWKRKTMRRASSPAICLKRHIELIALHGHQILLVFFR